MKGLVQFSFVFMAGVLSGCLPSQRQTTSTAPVLGASQLASSSVLAPPAFDHDWLRAAQIVLEDVQASRFDSSVCVSYLRDFSQSVRKLRPGEVPSAERESGLKAKAAELSETLWQIRFRLHQRLADFSPDCVARVKETFRELRALEDYLGEVHFAVQSVDPATMDFKKIPVPFLETAPGYWTQRAPGVPRQIGFKPGDIIIVRGISYISAMTGKVADRESQLNHLIFMHVDESTRKAQTIEAYMGKGTAIYELNEALKNENARMVIVRAKNRALAERADQLFYARVKASLESKKIIRYDYGFDFNDHSRLSCAEVPRAAYDEASGGSFIIPAIPSVIKGSADFLSSLNLKAGPTFAAGDLEADPRFDLIAEFRDLKITRDSRIKDAVLAKVLEWMDEKGYELQWTGKSLMAGWVIKPLSVTPAWPVVQATMSLPDFIRETPRRMLQTVHQVSTIGELLLAHLRQQDAAHQAKTGWPMTMAQMYEELESYRKRDQDLYLDPKTREQALLHPLFRP